MGRTSYVAVLPFLYRPYFEACTASCRLDFWAIDNTQENVGCTVAWNMGLRAAMDGGFDWCIWMSSACRFGIAGGGDFLDALDRSDGAHVVESQVRGHLIAISTETTKRIGYCDENFYPSYWQDTDWARRVRLGFGADLDWRRIEADVRSESIGHSVREGGLSQDASPLAAYYSRKWGEGGIISPWEEASGEWAHPFNDPAKPLSWWPASDEPQGLPRPPRGRFIRP